MYEGLAYSTESIMRSLENLKCSITLFNMTEEQKEHIQTKMKKCKDCTRWKFNTDLYHGTCVGCSGREKKSTETIKSRKSKKKPQDNKAFSISETTEEKWLRDAMKITQSVYIETVYISLREYIMKGMSIREALGEMNITSKKFYEDVPKNYRDRLMDIKKAVTLHRQING